MSKYRHEVHIEVTGAQGVGTHFGGYVRVINESARLTVELDTDNVISQTVACFNRELRKELERFGALHDDEFKDAVRIGFCEYIVRLFGGRWDR